MLIAGLPGILAGLGLGALDTFVLQKLTDGWRPHGFVNALEKFVGKR
jgi:hypothetical protein